MLRNRFIEFLCGLAGHPEEPLYCALHESGVIISWVCVCGKTRYLHGDR